MIERVATFCGGMPMGVPIQFLVSRYAGQIETRADRAASSCRSCRWRSNRLTAHIGRLLPKARMTCRGTFSTFARDRSGGKFLSQSRRSTLGMHPPPIYGGVMQAFPISALNETDLDPVIEKIGGFRAHPEATRSETINADYVVGQTVIELKMLDEESFEKPGRQAKLAELFRASQPARPAGGCARSRPARRARAAQISYDRRRAGQKANSARQSAARPDPQRISGDNWLGPVGLQ